MANYISTDPNAGTPMTGAPSPFAGGGFTPTGGPAAPNPNNHPTGGNIVFPGGQSVPMTPPAAGAGSSSGGTGAPAITDPHDPNQVRAWFQWQASQPGADPILKTPGGIDYYMNAWQGTGDAFDAGYWGPKSTLAQYGGAVGAGAGGGGGFGSGWATLPSASDFLNSPGAQAALQRGQQGIQNTALARGTGLSGGVLKDLADFTTNDILQGYGNYANTNLNYINANNGNLLNWAQQGQNSSSVGSTGSPV